jgi:hypothetical protein
MTLRKFLATRIDKDCSMLSGLHINELFYGCKFNRLNYLTLKDCDLNNSTFETAHIKDALGFTLTLSCLSFRNVRFSELLFDLLLMLMTLTVGNDEKREKLLDVVGRSRATALLRIMERTE